MHAIQYSSSSKWIGNSFEEESFDLTKLAVLKPSYMDRVNFQKVLCGWRWAPIISDEKLIHELDGTVFCLPALLVFNDLSWQSWKGGTHRIPKNIRYEQFWRADACGQTHIIPWTPNIQCVCWHTSSDTIFNFSNSCTCTVHRSPFFFQRHIFAWLHPSFASSTPGSNYQ